MQLRRFSSEIFCDRHVQCFQFTVVLVITFSIQSNKLCANFLKVPYTHKLLIIYDVLFPSIVSEHTILDSIIELLTLITNKSHYCTAEADGYMYILHRRCWEVYVIRTSSSVRNVSEKLSLLYTVRSVSSVSFLNKRRVNIYRFIYYLLFF